MFHYICLTVCSNRKYIINMIELPEAITIGRQVEQTLAGRCITNVYGATHLHKFTFFSGTPEEIRDSLVGRTVRSAVGKGIFVDVCMDEDVFLCISDGINMRYGRPGDPVPSKYQLLITFDDESYVSFTTSMYGSISVFRHALDNKYHTLSLESVSPLSEQFDESFYEGKLAAEQKNISVKAFLATEQRIPGLGNGVLQDILFNAKLHPKRKIHSLSDTDKTALFHSLKNTLQAMTDGGGRDTETDFLGNRGRYRSVLSKNTYTSPCPCCGGIISKEAYLGGTVYFCPDCQPLHV